ncbi:MAG: type III-B CRISPR module RAMP protein Cmr6 [Eubacterium sp.]|nr:type III-B CRISPR module RAMP protein Cmr6 [Eubacterium sp.]
MRFQSRNMNYIFNIEYYEKIDIPKPGQKADEDMEKEIKKRNKEIEQFSFQGNEIPAAELENCAYEKRYSYKSFRLYTRYPGLLTGIGYPHDIKMKEAVKCGFLFDYVTGLPYISGSTVKGMLRSFFPGDNKSSEVSQAYEAYIKGLLQKGEHFGLQGLKEDLFEYHDRFLGAYPDAENCEKGILKMEYITPHETFKDPNPISILKVQPNVPFVFRFLLTDYKIGDKVVVSADEKLKLFQKLILDMGIGAKTNVGFGRFSERRTSKNYEVRV